MPTDPRSDRAAARDGSYRSAVAESGAPVVLRTGEPIEFTPAMLRHETLHLAMLIVAFGFNVAAVPFGSTFSPIPP